MRRASSLAVVCLAATFASAQMVSDEEKKEGFKPLFDGKTLEGWKTTKEILRNWKAEDGILKMNGRGSHLFTKGEFEDFVVRFEWKAHKPGYNSGFFIRGSNQIQMWERDAGQLFANAKEGKAVPELHKPAGEWNEWEVTCVGSKVSLKVNGKQAWEVNDFKPKKGPLGIEAEGSAIDFKNLRIKVIEPKKG